MIHDLLFFLFNGKSARQNSGKASIWKSAINKTPKRVGLKSILHASLPSRIVGNASEKRNLGKDSVVDGELVRDGRHVELEEIWKEIVNKSLNQIE